MRAQCSKRRSALLVIGAAGVGAIGGATGAADGNAPGLSRAAAPPEPAGSLRSQAPPKLIVLVVVDQLRGDMLPAYSDVFTDGLRKLLDDGFRFTRATHDHAVTSTAPGHATLATGLHPSHHGIVANEWYEIEDDRLAPAYSVEDSLYPILGYTGYQGRSPSKLVRDGLPDWLRAVDDDARIVSVSRKDVAAILMAGRGVEGEVYWLLRDFGKFATSRFYEERYPTWVVRFNEEILPEIYSDTIWKSGIPEGLLHRTRPDTSDFEGRPGQSSFPHAFRAGQGFEGERGLMRWRYETPLPDKAVLHMAMEAIDERRLGQRNNVDYLAIGFSQADAMGHAYGPRSREQLDNLIRLDGLVGELIDFLDEEVGEGNWVMALSSDHGVSDIPELLDEPVDRLDAADVREVLQTAQQALVASGRSGDVRRRLAAALEPLPSIRRVLDFDELEQPADSFARFFANSHARGRPLNELARQGVYIHWEPHMLVAPSWATRRVGTDHRSAYYFDRWVPLIFYGAGVEAGWSDGRAATVDVAPTLAAMVGVPAPDDIDGRVLPLGTP